MKKLRWISMLAPLALLIASLALGGCSKPADEGGSKDAALGTVSDPAKANETKDTGPADGKPEPGAPATSGPK